MTGSQEDNPDTTTGGDIICGMLAAEGVDTVFGIADRSIAALCASFKKNGIRLISPTHDTNAVHMAGAYARITGKPGVCIAGKGPGMANALSGIAVENAEGHRVLLISSSAGRTVHITLPKAAIAIFPKGKSSGQSPNGAAAFQRRRRRERHVRCISSVPHRQARGCSCECSGRYIK